MEQNYNVAVYMSNKTVIQLQFDIKRERNKGNEFNSDILLHDCKFVQLLPQLILCFQNHAWLLMCVRFNWFLRVIDYQSLTSNQACVELVEVGKSD